MSAAKGYPEYLLKYNNTTYFFSFSFFLYSEYPGFVKLPHPSHLFLSLSLSRKKDAKTSLFVSFRVFFVRLFAMQLIFLGFSSSLHSLALIFLGYHLLIIFGSSFILMSLVVYQGFLFFECMRVFLRQKKSKHLESNSLVHPWMALSTFCRKHTYSQGHVFRVCQLFPWMRCLLYFCAITLTLRLSIDISTFNTLLPPPPAANPSFCTMPLNIMSLLTGKLWLELLSVWMAKKKDGRFGLHIVAVMDSTTILLIL